MTTKLPRINVVIEPQIYAAIYRLSKKQHISMSLAARDLLKEALLIYEDAYWAKEAGQREKTLPKKNRLSHKQVWG